MRIFDSGVYRNMTAEEESAYFESTVPTDEQAFTRYANTLTGASDQTLIEAAGTLIDKYSESKDKAEAYDILMGEEESE